MLKTLIKILQPIRRLYWRIFQPTTQGVRAILVNHNGQILLVRHSYQDGWYLPGGQVHKKEAYESALRRELEEELGVSEITHMEKLGEYANTYEYKKDTIVVFIVSFFAQQEKAHFEIEKFSLFDPQSLPDSTSPGTRRRVEEWLKKKPVSNQW